MNSEDILLHRLGNTSRRSEWEKSIATLDEIDEYIDQCDENRAKIAKMNAAYEVKRDAYYKTLPAATQRKLRALKLARLDKSDVGAGRVAPKVAVAPRDPPGVGGAFLARQLMDDAQRRINAYWNVAR